MSLELVKQMLSIPSQKPLTATQRFACWSAFLAYFVGGLSMILAPDLWNIIFRFDLNTRAKGNFLLMGGALMIIGFCLIVLSRHKSGQIPGHGVILATVLGRLLGVNWRLFTLYNQGVITLSFALLFSLLDSGLALITYAIWSREVEGASLERFFSEIWTVVNPCPTSQMKSVYVIFQLIGLFQFAGGSIAPSFFQSTGIVPEEAAGTHEQGLLLMALLMFSIHGWFHVLGGGASNRSFMMASLFYRVVWNIPYFLFLGFTSKIEIGLSKVLVSFDVVYSLIILVLLLIEVPRMKKN